MNHSLIILAAQAATIAHQGQLRKYGAGPYILHPMRVALKVSLSRFCCDETVCAALLHDTFEDCGLKESDLEKAGMTEDITCLVRELTNERHDKSIPRAVRKERDRRGLKKASQIAKAIKMMDRLDNLEDLAGADRQFVQLYVEETLALLDVIGEADRDLATQVTEAAGRLSTTPPPPLSAPALRK